MDRMSSIGKECDELKHKYDDCFNDWFNNGYLKEKPKSNKDNKQAIVPCEALFLSYQECTKKVRGILLLCYIPFILICISCSYIS